MSDWALPVGFALAMVGFTALRKLGYGRLLKGHQRSIALGVAVTVVAPTLANLGYLEPEVAAGHTVQHALYVLAPQAACFVASLVLRKENEPIVAVWSYLWFGAMLAAQTLMCGYLSLAAGLVGAAIGVMLKGRMGNLLLSWAVLCLAVTFFCLFADEGSPAVGWIFVLVEVETLLLVKLEHPDEQQAGGGGAAAGGSDVELGWSW